MPKMSEERKKELRDARFQKGVVVREIILAMTDEEFDKIKYPNSSSGYHPLFQTGASRKCSAEINAYHDTIRERIRAKMNPSEIKELDDREREEQKRTQEKRWAIRKDPIANLKRKISITSCLHAKAALQEELKVLLA